WGFGPGIACKASGVTPPVSANGSPAFGQYKPSPDGGHEPWALIVLELSDGRIGELTFFLGTERLFPLFGLAPRLGAEGLVEAHEGDQVPEVRGGLADQDTSAQAARGQLQRSEQVDRPAVRCEHARVHDDRARLRRRHRQRRLRKRPKLIGSRPMSSDAGCRLTGRTEQNRYRPNRPMTVSDTRTDIRNRWLALIVLCLGDLMIVLDTTIVNVALPSIRDDLGFSETSLAWAVKPYLLTLR